MATFYGPGNVKAGYGSIVPGELIFDANFECGNLGRVDIINKCEYDLFIRPDTCNANYRVWFYFKVWNAAENQSVLLNICNFSKKRTMFEKGDAAPVYKKPNSTEWYRIKRSNVFYSVSNLHGQKPILSITFNFKCDGIYEFAYCIPYGYSHLQKYIHKLETQHSAFLRRDIIAQSVMKKNIDLLTISNHIHSIPKKQKVIFITARVHPGETPASHVLHGLLDFLVSDDYKAFELRDNYTFKIIPMLNPDGVYIGNYRCNIVGNDLNRQYLEPSSWAHPSIMSVKNLLIQYENNSDIELIFCIDIHAHSQQTNGFLIGNLLSKNPQHCETQLILPYLMAENAEDYSLSRTQFNVDSDKAGTSRRTLSNLVSKSCLCFTFEISFFSFHPNDDENSKTLFYLQHNYENLGNGLGVALFNYYLLKNNKRTIKMFRSFESFLPKRSMKVFKGMEKQTSTNKGSTSSIKREKKKL